MNCLIVEYDGHSDYNFYDGLVAKDFAKVTYSAKDKNLNPDYVGKTAALLQDNGDGVRVYMPRKEGSVEVYLDYTEIEMMGMLYFIYNTFMKQSGAASLEVYEFAGSESTEINEV